MGVFSFYLRSALLCLFAGYCLQGCVSAKKYHASQDSLTKCQEVNSVDQSILKILKRDTAECGIRYRNLDSAKAYIEAVSSSEKKHLNEQLNKKSQEVSQKDQALQEREMKVNMLNGVLRRKDSVFNMIKDEVSSALSGYSFTQLSIEYKDDKAYISIEEDMLFKPASPSLDPKSKEVLSRLSDALNKLPGVQALIEGNTDSLPPSNLKISDNWDMSVLRAASVTRELVKEGVNPQKLVAAGCSSYNPIAPNDIPEARSKNRRIVVVISQKNDELNKLLEK